MSSGSGVSATAKARRGCALACTKSPCPDDRCALQHPPEKSDFFLRYAVFLHLCGLCKLSSIRAAGAIVEEWQGGVGTGKCRIGKRSSLTGIE